MKVKLESKKEVADTILTVNKNELSKLEIMDQYLTWRMLGDANTMIPKIQEKVRQEISEKKKMIEYLTTHSL